MRTHKRRGHLVDSNPIEYVATATISYVTKVASVSPRRSTLASPPEKVTQRRGRPPKVRMPEEIIARQAASAHAAPSTSAVEAPALEVVGSAVEATSIISTAVTIDVAVETM